MSADASDKTATTVSFAPILDGPSDANIVADDSGRAIVALLQKAAEMAQGDCARAMDLAHKLSSQLQVAEGRASALEAEAAHFRNRAARARSGCNTSIMKSSKRSFRRRIALGRGSKMLTTLVNRGRP
jgi:hypothetical protein